LWRVALVLASHVEALERLVILARDADSL